jgi:CheY-like chemotaxis protein
MAQVILVEDDPDTGESIRAMLELGGHAVHWAHNGREAMACLKQQTGAHLVLTDILMPDMDGIETIQYIRKHFPSLPMVAMTAQRQTPYLRAATLFGVRATLQKPFTTEELEAAIVTALRPATPPAP